MDEPHIQPENETLPLVQFWEQQKDQERRSFFDVPELSVRDRICDEMYANAIRYRLMWHGISEIENARCRDLLMAKIKEDIDRVKD